MRLLFILFIFIKAATAVSGQNVLYENLPILPDDNELSQYLADTAHAAQNITRLVNRADKISRDIQSSEAIKLFLVALQLEEFAKDSVAVRITLHNRFSARVATAGAMELSLKHAKIALELAKGFSSPHSGYRYNQYAKIASIYTASFNSDSAFYYYRKALSEAQQEGEYLWISSGWNNLGIWFSKNNQLDSATICYTQALSILRFRVAQDTGLLRSIRDNIAEVAIAKKDFHTAISNYELNLTLTKMVSDTGNLLHTLYGMANVFLFQGQPGKTKIYLDEAEHLLLTYKTGKYFERKIQLTELWIRYYEASGNLKAAIEKQKWLLKTNDSIDANNKEFIKEIMQTVTQSELSKFEKGMQLSKLELQQKQTELSNIRSQANRNKIGIFLCLCIIILGYLYWRNRNKAQQNLLELNTTKLNLSEADLRNKQLEKEKVESDLKLSESLRLNEQLEKEKIERELKYKKGDLNDLSIYLTNLKELNTKIVDKLNDAKKNNAKDVKELVKEINTEIGSQLQSDKKRQLMQENLDAVNKEFYDKLHQQFPDLSRSEIELCGLLRLNMSNKDIGALKNITTESAKVARHRLRKKLNLTSDEDIYKFVSRI